MSALRSILVIGGGPAGVAAALAAKQQDAGAAVVLLSDEHCEPYEKPPLSKAVLTGKAMVHDAPIAGPKGAIERLAKRRGGRPRRRKPDLSSSPFEAPHHCASGETERVMRGHLRMMGRGVCSRKTFTNSQSQDEVETKAVPHYDRSIAETPPSTNRLAP
jgi:Pyridine nucleotide-disulphide oxidoreductase